MEKHGSALYAYAYAHLHDQHHAEDMLQETLLAALKGARHFQQRSSVRTWLIGILKHKIMDEFRRRSREVVSDDSAEAVWERAEAQRVTEQFDAQGRWNLPSVDYSDAEQALSQQQFWQLIEACLEGLSPRAARLFVLREVWGLETGEVCKELEITPTNLWTTLHRARLSMRRCLESSL
ncbi:MAG: sigma-70 family RNA polymerase sigma factor [Gammaproteobacteria bacterium]|nr:sigma-70 family RNA polymerase sigma factor [Gammaproteobacteria bacterium]